MTFDVVGVEIGVFEVEDVVGVDDEVEVEEEDEDELVELVELVLEVDELDTVEELEAEGGGILEAGAVELGEAETGEGVGVWELLGDGVVEVLGTGGSLLTTAAPCSS